MSDNSSKGPEEKLAEDIELGQLPEPDKRKGTVSSERRFVEKHKLWFEIFFFVLLAGVVCGDVYFLVDSQTWSLPIVVGMLELMGFAVLARRWNIEGVAELIDNSISSFGKNKNAAES